ncbi:MAG: hypothetical protein EXS36_18210 [Pedosphaera sp.]|nr:hypothetical protein [Pedosphaera sp.]
MFLAVEYAVDEHLCATRWVRIYRAGDVSPKILVNGAGKTEQSLELKRPSDAVRRTAAATRRRPDARGLERVWNPSSSESEIELRIRVRKQHPIENLTKAHIVDVNNIIDRLSCWASPF